MDAEINGKDYFSPFVETHMDIGSAITALDVIQHSFQNGAVAFVIEPVTGSVSWTGRSSDNGAHALIARNCCLWMNQDAGERPVGKCPYGRVGTNYIPAPEGTPALIAHKSVQGGTPVVAIADTEQEASQILFPDRRNHSVGIVAAGARKAKLMMGMPLADMPKSITVLQHPSDSNKIVSILIEESHLMIGFRTRTDDIKHNRDTITCIIAKELPAGFNILAVKDTSGDIIQFRLKDDDVLAGCSLYLILQRRLLRL